MKMVLEIGSVIYNLVWLGVAIVLAVKVWRACDALQELNRTVQFMAYDIKDLRDKGKPKANPADGDALPGQQPWE